MQQAALLAFCRTVIGVVFAVALIGKLRSWQSIPGTIRGFRIVPEQFLQPAAVVVVLSELVLLVLLVLWPFAAFLLATGSLLMFSFALISVLLRNIRTPCNCFGTSTAPVSPLDVVRNGGVLLCSAGGCWLSTQPQALSAELTFVELGLAGIIACAYALVWMQLSEVYRLVLSK